MNPQLEFDPRLVEESVRLALRGHPDERGFHSEREEAYEPPDPEARENLFLEVYARWFKRLGLGDPVRRALLEHRAALARVQRCVVGPAVSDKQAGAEMFVTPSGERSVMIRVRPAVLVRPGKAMEFLRRELLHVADMLDPDFEYEPRLPRRPSGPSEDRLLRDRYAVLWRCSVEGRLVREKKLPGMARESCLAEFRRAFACLGESVGPFDRIFSGPRPLHPVLVALAMEPEAGFGVRSLFPPSGGRCPLCNFPVTRFEPEPGNLPAAVLLAVRSDFPSWKVDQGLCPQCADLYRALSAPEALTGIP